MDRIVLIMAGYLLGSIPFGLIVGKLWKGVDIRRIGSGNIGATNIMRVLGPGPAAVVFALDVLKGLLPVAAARHFFPGDGGMAVLIALTAVLGHTFSVFLRMRGGKGVATGLGVFLGLDWRVALGCFAVWIIVVAVTRYVSLASITASIGIPVGMFVVDAPFGYKMFAVGAAAFIVWKHRSNIDRLLRSKEHRWGQKVG